jgi:hypothetical protein
MRTVFVRSGAPGLVHGMNTRTVRTGATPRLLDEGAYR